MKLDVVIPTYNRQELLTRTLQSLLDAPIPAELDVVRIVADNNSTDGTKDVVEQWKRKFGGQWKYVFESVQGRSSALNAGISAGDGDLVGFIDDDEEIDSTWYQVVYEAFQDESLDFVGGRSLPRWGASVPRWLPAQYACVIGVMDFGQKRIRMDAGFSALLIGGNAVIRRDVLEKVGRYNTSLGRTGDRLLTDEDAEMYQRLLEAGAHGLYIPELIIHHYIPPERLTKNYYRRWCFWRNVSQAIGERTRVQQVVHLAGIPRWLFGAALSALLDMPKAGSIRRDSARFFYDELAFWNLAGFLYGRYFYRR